MTNDNNSLIGQSVSLENKVTKAITALAFAVAEGEDYAEVLATPHLIADMERACAKILEPIIAPGQVSVGAHIDVKHLAATGIGASYTVTATLIEKKWGLFTFEVTAKDSVGMIGKGQIIRAIASIKTIMQRGQQAT